MAVSIEIHESYNSVDPLLKQTLEVVALWMELPYLICVSIGWLEKQLNPKNLPKQMILDFYGI